MAVETGGAVVIRWDDDISGAHQLRFAWDESIEEVTVTATDFAKPHSTVWSLTREEARQVAGLLLRSYSSPGANVN